MCGHVGVTMPVQSGQQRSSLVELQRGGRVVARLQWRSHPRDAVGWYLQRRGRPARHLEIDAGIDALARDTRSDHHGWQQRADAIAWLSTALALDAADRALRGGLAAPPARPLEPGRYELTSPAWIPRCSPARFPRRRASRPPMSACSPV